MDPHNAQMENDKSDFKEIDAEMDSKIPAK
jgi:hypothetical protein